MQKHIPTQASDRMRLQARPAPQVAAKPARARHAMAFGAVVANTDLKSPLNLAAETTPPKPISEVGFLRHSASPQSAATNNVAQSAAAEPLLTPIKVELLTFIRQQKGVDGRPVLLYEACCQKCTTTARYTVSAVGMTAGTIRQPFRLAGWAVTPKKCVCPDCLD